MDDDFDDISDEIADDMNAPAPGEPEAAEPAEPLAASADNDDSGDDFESDDFEADDFAAEPVAAADADDGSDDDAGSDDDFETDEFDADEFTAGADADAVSGTEAADDDHDDEFAAETDDFETADAALDNEVPAAAVDEPEPVTPDIDIEPEAEIEAAVEQAAAPEASADNDLDAMLSAKSSRTDGFDDFEEPVPTPADVPDDMAASADMSGFDSGDSAGDDDDLMPSSDAVAGLGDDDGISPSETTADIAAEPVVEQEADDDDMVAASADAEPVDLGDQDDDEFATAGAVAGAAAAAAVMVDETARDFDDEDDEDEAPPPPPRAKKKKRQRGPGVPLIDIGEGGFHKLAEAYPKRLRAVHDLAVRKLTEKGLKFVDGACKKWADKASVPYRLEIDGVSTALQGDPGTYVINLAFEMACTTGAVEDPEGGSRLLHTLDWKLDGLGRLAVAARRHAPAGMWVNVTWPGYVGCLQGVAPGRFAAAINHAPINGKGPGYLAWPMSKLKWWGQKGVPPGLLLRKVFDECEDFDSAVEMIERTPIAYPAIFSVLGTQEGEFSIIERTENSKSTQKRAPAVTNHWLNNEFRGTVMAYQSNERLVAMKSRINKGIDADEWLVHPILNPETRLAVDLNPTTGRMRIRGYQGLQPTTSLLDIYAD
tara:strand:+ start:30604 stop:32571 length:1968 start_codon:yes stop_codon:yes gene_type:complete